MALKTEPGSERRLDLHALALAAVLVVVALIRLRLLDVPFERDEGEYAYFGNLILHGGVPYRDAYNMKLPGVYGMYSLIIAVFGSSPAGVHAGLAIMSLATAALLYAAIRRLFTPMTGLSAATVYALLSVSSPMLGAAAHATQFVNFFVVFGLWVYSRWNDRRPLLYASATGLSFGLAVLMKQHAAFLALFGGMIAVQRAWANTGSPRKTIAAVAATYTAAALIPYGVVVLIVAAAGAFDRFWFWTVTYAMSYASPETPWNVARALFAMSFSRIFSEYPLVWVLAPAGLVLLWAGRFSARQRWVATGLAAASTAALLPGFNFREHYFVLLVPAAGLLAAVALEFATRAIAAVREIRAIHALPFVAIAAWSVVAILNGRAYYLDDPPGRVSQLMYPGNPFAEAPAIAARVAADTAPSDTIAVLGSEPEIFVYAGRRSASGYLYVYPLVERQPYNLRMQREMIAEIEAASPKYLLYCNVPASWAASPGAPTEILQWFNRYGGLHYDVVGIVEIGAPGSDPAFFWDAEARRHPPGPNSIWVLRRK